MLYDGPAVDHERVLLRLKGELQSKRSWGTGELAQLIMRLEVESELPREASPRAAAPSGPDDAPPEATTATATPPVGMPEAQPTTDEGVRHGTQRTPSPNGRQRIAA